MEIQSATSLQNQLFSLSPPFFFFLSISALLREIFSFYAVELHYLYTHKFISSVRNCFGTVAKKNNSYHSRSVHFGCDFSTIFGILFISIRENDKDEGEVSEEISFSLSFLPISGAAIVECMFSLFFLRLYSCLRLLIRSLLCMQCTMNIRHTQTQI